MNITEALDWMQEHHPDRSTQIKKEAWYYARQTSHANARPEPFFTIAVLPGFDGSNCQNFKGSSLEECIQQVKEATRDPIAGEPNNE